MKLHQKCTKEPTQAAKAALKNVFVKGNHPVRPDKLEMLKRLDHAAERNIELKKQAKLGQKRTAISSNDQENVGDDAGESRLDRIIQRIRAKIRKT